MGRGHKDVAGGEGGTTIKRRESTRRTGIDMYGEKKFFLKIVHIFNQYVAADNSGIIFMIFYTSICNFIILIFSSQTSMLSMCVFLSLYVCYFKFLE